MWGNGEKREGVVEFGRIRSMGCRSRPSSEKKHFENQEGKKAKKLKKREGQFGACCRKLRRDLGEEGGLREKKDIKESRGMLWGSRFVDDPRGRRYGIRQ